MPRARIGTLVLCGLIALAVVPGIVALVVDHGDPQVAYLAVVLPCLTVPLVAALVVSAHAPGNVVDPCWQPSRSSSRSSRAPMCTVPSPAGARSRTPCGWSR